MEVLKNYLESRFPTLNEIDKAHIESLIKDIQHKCTSEAYQAGYDAGRLIGTIEGEREERLRQQGWS